MNMSIGRSVSAFSRAHGGIEILTGSVLAISAYSAAVGLVRFSDTACAEPRSVLLGRCFTVSGISFVRGALRTAIRSCALRDKRSLWSSSIGCFEVHLPNHPDHPKKPRSTS